MGRLTSFLFAVFLERSFRLQLSTSRCVDDASDIISSSVSEETLPETMVAGCCGGKQNVGRVGMETGREGLDERLRRCGKVGEIGDDWGVFRRKNVEMGVFAM